MIILAASPRGMDVIRYELCSKLGDESVHAPTRSLWTWLCLAKKTWIAALLLALVSGGAWAGYVAAKLADDGTHLVITVDDGSQFSAPMFGEQVGFQDPRITSNGKYVGWLALYPNCCTSYPIPLGLVVLDSSRGLHTFDGIKIAVFKWCFLPHSSSVAYMQTVVHGSNFEHFELRSIASGNLLAEYEYPDEEPDNTAARRSAPSWVRCVEP